MAGTAPRHVLRTLGHATLVLYEDDVPVLATDPWLVGSVYWRSWWLEKYPTPADVEDVRRSTALYVTHTHPDHFHTPSLRKLGKRPVLVPRFPRDDMPKHLSGMGHQVEVLRPWQWYRLTPHVRIASIPVPIDDSIVVADTPHATIVDVNDAMPRTGVLRAIRRDLCAPGKPIVMLKSYAPASMAVALFREGERRPMKTKNDYVDVVQRMADVLGADYYVPFASQAFFSRRDSRWANEFKVVYEDLRATWSSGATLLEPFITLDLATFDHSSEYASVRRELDEEGRAKLREQEDEEAAFRLPADFDARLKRYLDEVHLLRMVLRRGIGFRLTTSREERYYRSGSRAVEHAIPADHDLVIELPDKVLSEALERNTMTDLGITMIISVHTRVSDRVAYAVFLLMGLHDYGHFRDLWSFWRLGRFYLPYVFPFLLRPRAPKATARPLHALARQARPSLSTS